MASAPAVVEVGAQHRRARRAEQHGRGPPDPRRRPGDDGHAPAEIEGAQASGFMPGALPWMDAVTRRAAPQQGVAEARDLLPRQLLGQPHHGERQRHGAVGPEDRRRDLAEAVGGTLLELLEEVLLVGEVLHRHGQRPAPAVAARQGPAQLQVGHGLEVEGVAATPDDGQGRTQPLLVLRASPRVPAGPATTPPRRARPRPGTPSREAGRGGRAGPR